MERSSRTAVRHASGSAVLPGGIEPPTSSSKGWRLSPPETPGAGSSAESVLPRCASLAVFVVGSRSRRSGGEIRTERGHGYSRPVWTAAGAPTDPAARSLPVRGVAVTEIDLPRARPTAHDGGHAVPRERRARLPRPRTGTPCGGRVMRASGSDDPETGRQCQGTGPVRIREIVRGSHGFVALGPAETERHGSSRKKRAEPWRGSSGHVGSPEFVVGV